MGVSEAFHKKTFMSLIYLWVHNFRLRKENWVYHTPMMSKKTSGNRIFCCFRVFGPGNDMTRIKMRHSINFGLCKFPAMKIFIFRVPALCIFLRGLSREAFCYIGNASGEPKFWNAPKSKTCKKTTFARRKKCLTIKKTTF